MAVFSIFETLYFDEPVLQLFIKCYNSNGINQMPNHCSKMCDHFLDSSGYDGKSITCSLNILILASSRLINQK